MTIEYIDGFDDYSYAQMGRYWAVDVASTAQSVPASSGRNSSGCYRCINPATVQSGTHGPVKATTTSATRTIGLAFKIAALPAAAGYVPILSFLDVGTQQLTLRINSDATWALYRGTAAGTLLGTCSGTLATDTWYYIEAAVTINNTTGDYTIKLNGATVLSGSGANTRNTANNSCNAVALVSPTADSSNGSYTANMDYDDLYITNDTTPLGDCRVETKLPTGNGATNNWTRGGADSGNNWDQVNENPATDATDYNFASSVGDIDLYTFPALATTAGAIKAVAVVMIAENESAGTSTIDAAYRIGGVNYFSADINMSTSSFLACIALATVSPATSSAWTVSEVNAAQFGAKRIA